MINLQIVAGMTKTIFRTSLVLIPLAFIIGVFALVGPSSARAFVRPETQVHEKDILERAFYLLNGEHYIQANLNDTFSQKAFDLFIERSDYTKKILLQSDIDELKALYYNQIDDQTRAGRFDFMDHAVRIIEQRTNENRSFCDEILAQPFDFTIDESVELDPKKINRAKDQTELREYWRKQLKYQTLSRFVSLKEEQEKAAQKNESGITAKSDAELEAEARAKVKKAQDVIFNRLVKLDREDRLSTFLNALTSVYDPHTTFMPPKDKENFDIRMSGQLEGIGSTLQEKEGVLTVTHIVPGSPCWKQGQLKVGDEMLKVAQGDQEPVDVVGMRLDDAVRMIRGKKGTEVRLTVKKPDGSIVVIPIVRDVIQMEETFAQSAVIHQGKKYGYIKLPSFYADFSRSKTNPHYSSEDVRLEIEKLKKEKIKGIILDLRDNGGGSLTEVVKMVSLFIPEGPVVQVKNRDERVTIYDDKDKGAVAYDGQLVVLINENSASASEILAAAIQDYRRGVIVGGNSFGKGTVQNLFNLDKIKKEPDSPLGTLKLTIQKFYRINGGSTQLKGVAPDIALPDQYALIEDGEKDLEYALPWDQISAARFTFFKPVEEIQQLQQQSASRIAGNARFQLIQSKSTQLKREKDNTLKSLLLTTYIAQRKKIEEENKIYKALEEPMKGFKAKATSVDLDLLENDSARMALKTDWIEKLTKDVYVSEAASILHDMR